MAGKKKFLIQFEYGYKKEISDSSLVFLSSKEEVDMDEALSHSLEKEQGEMLNIVGNTEVRENCMFVNGTYFSIFYCLYYEMDVSTDISEEQVSEERDPDLN